MKPQSCNILNCYPICARINKCLPWDFLHCCLIPEEVTRLNKYNKPTICFLIFTLFLLKFQLVSLAYFSIFCLSALQCSKFCHSFAKITKGNLCNLFFFQRPCKYTFSGETRPCELVKLCRKMCTLRILLENVYKAIALWDVNKALWNVYKTCEMFTKL